MSKLPHIVRQRLAVPSSGNAGADHPDADLLTAFAERQLAGPERERVLAHVGRCATCREIVALATPETVAAQPVLTPARSRSWWSIRSYQYGVLAAALAVAAIGLALLRPNHSQEAPVAAVAQTNASTARSDAAAGSLPEMQQEPATPATRSQEQARIAAAGSADRTAAKKSFTVAAPSAAPPKELDKLADNSSYTLTTGRVEAKRDRDIRYSNAVNEPAVLADASTQRQQQAKTGPSRSDDDTINVTSADVAAAAPEKVAPQAPTASNAVTAVAHAGAPPGGTPQVRSGAARDSSTAQTAEVGAANDAATTETASSSNSRAGQDFGAAAGDLTAALQRAPANRARALAKTEEDKQKALARDPNYTARGVWRINNGRLQKLDPARNAFDDVTVGGTSRLSVVASLANEVWVGGADGALYYSNDQGAHWISVSTGGWSKDATFTGVTPTALRSVEVHLSNGERWRSADAGASWSRYQ